MVDVGTELIGGGQQLLGSNGIPFGALCDRAVSNRPPAQLILLPVELAFVVFAV